MVRLRTLGWLVAVCGLAACSEGAPELMNIRADNATPDEFGILPTRPLEQPEDFATLPPPTPGGVNRTDRNPRAEAFAALGGSANAGVSGNGALVTVATRFGVSPDIRQTLAAEDLEFRRDNAGRVLERVFNLNVYFDAYSEQSLDRYRELERLRAAGVRTVAAPPEAVAE